jgi:hypothetical protein
MEEVREWNGSTGEWHLRTCGRGLRRPSVTTASPVHQATWIRQDFLDSMDWLSPQLQRERQCPGAESNHRHGDFQSPALPTELPGRIAFESRRDLRRPASRVKNDPRPGHRPDSTRSHPAA